MFDATSTSSVTSNGPMPGHGEARHGDLIPTECDSRGGCGSSCDAAPSPALSSSAESHSPAPSVGEPCPTPLVWSEVLAAYHSESTPWELTNGSRRLVGRTWGEGPPLYLLNGFAATAEMSSLMLWLLREQFRCVVFDSFDDSSARKSRPAMNHFAADLLAVADHHGDNAIRVFGASFGAAVALQAALEAPARILGLVLQHGFAARPLSLSERVLAAWCRRSRRSLSAFPGRRRVQELNHRRWFPPFDGTRFEFLVESTGSIPQADLANKALATARFNITSRLGEIACPVMLVRTEGEGPIEARCHSVLEQGLKNARTEWMHSSGMHPSLTHPHRLVKLLKTFFASAPPLPA